MNLCLSGTPSGCYPRTAYPDVLDEPASTGLELARYQEA